MIDVIIDAIGMFVEIVAIAAAAALYHDLDEQHWQFTQLSRLYLLGVALAVALVASFCVKAPIAKIINAILSATIGAIAFDIPNIKKESFRVYTTAQLAQRLAIIIGAAVVLIVSSFKAICAFL